MHIKNLKSLMKTGARLTGLATALLSGCFQTPFSTTASISASGGGASTVQATTDTSGRTSGAYDPKASYSQQLMATGGDIAGTSVIFPPGSLSFATTISVESGASLANGSAFADLGLAASNAIASSGAAVIIRPSENVTLLQPMSLSIPLPTGYGLIELFLSDDDRLAILAKVFDANGELKSKLIPRKNITIENGNAKFDTMAFGAFQTVVLEQAVTEAVEAKTTEAISNKNGVAVITTSGVVAAADIATAEQKKPLTFQTFTASFSAIARKVAIASKLSESIVIKSCSLTLRDISTKAVRFNDTGANGESTDTIAAQIPITEKVEGNLEAAIACEANDGRIARSDWTAIGTVAKGGFTFVRFAPTYSPSTREVESHGETSENSAAITSCNFKFRDAEAPTVIVYETSTVAGSQNSQKLVLPDDVHGTIEVMATCTTVDKRSASTTWTALGSVAQVVTGTVTIDQITSTTLRINWPVPQDTSYSDYFRVECALSLAAFDGPINVNPIVQIQGWSPAAIQQTSMSVETGDLSPDTNYVFRVSTSRNISDDRVTRYYRLAFAKTLPQNAVNLGFLGSDTTPPTIDAYATVSNLATDTFTIGIGRAHDNVTVPESLKYKLVHSATPIVDLAGFNDESIVTVFRDWGTVSDQTITISGVSTQLQLFSYYTIGVEDEVGNISLHPSLGFMLPLHPMVLYEFENNVANTGYSSFSVESDPYPVTPITFSSAIKFHGTHSATFDGSQSLTASNFNLASFGEAPGLTEFTMGGWVYQTTPPSPGMALFGFDNFLEFGHGGSSTLAMYVGAETREFSATTSLTLNSWHHVVVSGTAGNGTNPGRVAIFLDGALIASTAVDKSKTRFNSGAAEADSFKIGGGVWSGSDTKFTGQMDDVFFSPRAYSDNVNRQMNSPLNCPLGHTLVGIDVQSGGIVDRLGIRCQAPGSTVVTSGPTMGGNGGGPGDFTCALDSSNTSNHTISSITVGIGSGFGADTLDDITVNSCRSTNVTSVSTAGSLRFGGSGPYSSHTYSCPVGTTAWGIKIEPSSQSARAGPVFGLNCR